MQRNFPEARRHLTAVLEIFEHQGILIRPVLVRASLADLLGI
jgi:hypothetical protein